MEKYKAILDLQAPAALKLSPDGTKVVYHAGPVNSNCKGDNPTSAIWLAEVGKQASSRQLTSGLFEDQNPKWTSDGKSILFASDRKEAGKKTGLYQLSLSGGEPVLLTNPDAERPISTFIVSPNGRYVAILRADEKTAEQRSKDDDKDDANVWGEDWQYDRLHILHLSTRHIETVVKGEFHISGCVWSSDSTRLAFVQATTPEPDASQWQMPKLKAVAVTTKTVESIGEFLKAPDASTLQWVGDKIYAVCYMSPDGTDTCGIVHSVSLKDGHCKVEFAGDTYDAGGLGSTRGTLVVLVHNDLADELQVFTLTSGSKSPVSVSSHGTSVGDRIARTAPIHCRSDDDNVALEGIFHFPEAYASSVDPDRPLRPLKTLVYPHGGPYYRHTDSFFVDYGWEQTLLRSGIAVLYPGYRGGSSHGKHFAGPHVAGTFDHADVITVTNHVVKSGLADPEDLIIGGWSQGGFLSYLAAVRNGTHGHGWQFRAAIPGAGVTDWDCMTLTSDVPQWEAIFGGGGIGHAPWDLTVKSNIKARAGSAIYEIAEAAKAGRIPPILILHGENDVRVPVTQAWAFQRACRAWGVDCKMVTYPREGHSFKERNHLVDMQRRVLEFCEQHFK